MNGVVRYSKLNTQKILFKNKEIIFLELVRAAVQKYKVEPSVKVWKISSGDIAKELSDLVFYCRTVPLNQESILLNGRNPYEMSSFSENKAEKLFWQDNFFAWYHKVFPFPYIYYVLNCACALMCTFNFFQLLLDNVQSRLS